jgi:transposase-like protein
VDETYISIRGRWHYLYRAVDKHGKTIDFLLRKDRGIAAAQVFFRKALASVAPRVPRKITLDGHVPNRRALWLLRREHPCWRNVTVRTNRYLNNLIEQDHRDQAAMRIDGRTQVVRKCGYHDLWDRTRAPHSQGTILV